MAEWKRAVAASVTATPRRALQLAFFGGANLITGYRIFYMLQHAKRAGVPRVSLLTDGWFWNDEASDWLIESGVDEIVLVAGDARRPPMLAGRVAEFITREGAPPVRLHQKTAHGTQRGQAQQEHRHAVARIRH
jgi:hypothetical protein